jgi:hypothetical protein
MFLFLSKTCQAIVGRDSLRVKHVCLRAKDVWLRPKDVCLRADYV